MANADDTRETGIVVTAVREHREPRGNRETSSHSFFLIFAGNVLRKSSLGLRVVVVKPKRTSVVPV